MTEFMERMEQSIGKIQNEISSVKASQQKDEWSIQRGHENAYNNKKLPSSKLVSKRTNFEWAASDTVAIEVPSMKVTIASVVFLTLSSEEARSNEASGGLVARADGKISFSWVCFNFA